jgi:gluconokinase
MAVDTECRPLTLLLIWADIRSAKQAKDLRSTELGKKIYIQTGTPIHPMSFLCKLLWVKDEQPELFSKAYKFISIREYVFAKLLGKYVIDYSMASTTGLFDHHQLKWSSDSLRLAGIGEDKLSTPVSTFQTLSGLSMDFALEMKIQMETPFIAGASDGCLAHLGCGAINQGDLSITIGTSGAVRMATSGYKEDDRGRIFNYRLDEKTYIVGGATNNGAVLLSWFAENIERTRPDGVAFVKEAFSVSGSEGLIFLPYLLGERAPMYDPQARGVFFGIGIQHHKAHFKRAMLEGICLGLKSIVNAVEEVVHPVERIMATGGFVHSSQWVQLLSDCLGKPVSVDSQEDASALGAAIQGFHALGIKTDFHQHRPAGVLFEPLKKNHGHYQKLFEIVESLYDKLKDDFGRIQDL